MTFHLAARCSLDRRLYWRMARSGRLVLGWDGRRFVNSVDPRSAGAAVGLLDAREARTGIIDCDVHPSPRSADEIREYMQPPFRDRYSGGGRGFFGNPVHGARLDSKPPSGGPPGSDPEFLRKQLIEEYGLAHAVLLPRAFCNLHPDPDFGTAIAAAFNDWLADTWLGRYNADG